MIESPVLEEAKELIRQRVEAKAKAEGEASNLRQNTLDNLELRFGSVPTKIAEKLTEVKDATRLRELHRLSVTCPTLRRSRLRYRRSE